MSLGCQVCVLSRAVADSLRLLGDPTMSSERPHKSLSLTFFRASDSTLSCSSLCVFER